MKKRNLLTGLAALTLAAMMIVGAALSAGVGSIGDEEIAAIVDTTTDASQVTSPIVEAVQRARGSVVGVNNYAITYGYYYGYGRGGNPGSQRESLAATGSGIVISAYGHVLTNYHVVEDASRVTLSDGKEEYEAQIVSFDDELDIAVLLCPQLDLPAAALGDSDQLQVGEWAIVIGNPLGKDFFRSVTLGVVSSLEREVESTTVDKYGRRTAVKNAMIQVDAAINSGNSGGGMFNTLGQLMGIPSIKYSSSFLSATTIDNIGMCIPINAAKPLIRKALALYNEADVKAAQEEKAQQGEASAASDDILDKPRMGVTVATLSTNNSAVAQGVLPKGAYVKEVEVGSPAETAGIQVGDIIVEVDGVVVASSDEMVKQLQDRAEGDVLAVKLYRAENILTAPYVSDIGEGEYIDVEVTLRIIKDPAA